MDNRPADTVSHDLDALFRLGVVAAMSDEQLLERFTAQSESAGEIAFEAIVRRHGPMVMGVCRALLGNQHDADDAFQATFIVLALRAGAVRKRRSLGPWLHGVAARICGRARLVSRRRREAELPAEALSDHRSHDPALADLHQVLDEELRRLPEKYRRPIVLCYLEGRSQEDAARELGWTKGTISGRLARAKEVLQRRLIRRGLAPAALAATSFASEAAGAAVSAPLLAATVSNSDPRELLRFEDRIDDGRGGDTCAARCQGASSRSSRQTVCLVGCARAWSVGDRHADHRAGTTRPAR